jgi:hypothetical protein
MFIEEGFRIRFANGEVIDFYADSKELKEQWMAAMSQVVGKPGIAGSSGGAGKDTKAWTEMVLKREKSTVRKNIVDQASRTKAPAPPMPPMPQAAMDVPVRKSSNQQAQQQQHTQHIAQQHHQSMPASAPRPKSPVRQQVAPPLPSSIPSPTGKTSRPVMNPRQSTGDMRASGHMRTESYQPAAAGSKSQSNSPVKKSFGLGLGGGLSAMSGEERRRKARSMLM